MEREFLARRYERTQYNSLAFNDTEVRETYEDNKNDYDKVTYRSFSVPKYLSDEEYDELEADGIELWEEVETDIGTMTVEEKIAYDKALSLADNENLTEDTFNELAHELAHNDHDDWDEKLVSKGSYNEGSVGDWVFDTARERGDVTIIDDDSAFVVVMFIERIVNDFNTATVRQAYISPSSTSDADWDQARVNAQVAMDNWANAGTGEDGFIELVKDVSMDTSTKFSGGLFKEMGKGAMGAEELDEWIFDDARKPGDFTMIKTDYGYFIVYFVEWGRAYNIVQTENNMRNESYSALREAMLKDLSEPTRDWLGMRFTTKA
jgi:hypothetical protein